MMRIVTLVFALQLASASMPQRVDSTDPCNLTDDPFCHELEKVRRAEERWFELDDRLNRENHVCDSGALVALNEARDAAAERYTAYRNYYARWLSHARQQETIFRHISVDQAFSIDHLRALIDLAQGEYERLIERRRMLNAVGQDGAAERALERLIDLGRQRLNNLRNALAIRVGAQTESQTGRVYAKQIADHASTLSHLVAAEGRLWDAYYDARHTRLTLNCLTSSKK